MVGLLKGAIDAHGREMGGSLSHVPAAPLAEPLNVVPPFGLVRPALNVLLGDGFEPEGARVAACP